MPPKKRLPNFSATEKMKLIQLIEEKKDIIENKKTDAISAREKEECWINLATQFNSTSIIGHREVSSLKTCWDNLKKKSRKYAADMRKEVYLTGMHIYLYKLIYINKHQY